MNAWPAWLRSGRVLLGLGNLMVDAVRNADLPIIQSVGLTYCVVVLTINTVVDSLYVILNPKLRIA